MVKEVTWNNVMKWSFTIGSPISLLSYVCLILIFTRYKNMRKHPGNLMLLTIICEIFKLNNDLVQMNVSKGIDIYIDIFLNI